MAKALPRTPRQPGWSGKGHRIFGTNIGSGTLTGAIQRDVQLNSGNLLIGPKGAKNNPVAAKECEILIIEPMGALNTDDDGGKLTVHEEPWI